MSEPRLAEALRAAFDEGFTRPTANAPAATLDLLAVEIAGQAYALRVAELQQIAACHAPVAIPSDAPALLGLVGVRGAVLPVFSLAVLLGHAAATASPAWMVIVDAGGEAIALAFDQLVGHRRIPVDALRADPHERRVHDHVRAAVRIDGVARGVIDLPSVTATLRDRRTDPPVKEPG